MCPLFWHEYRRTTFFLNFLLYNMCFAHILILHELHERHSKFPSVVLHHKKKRERERSPMRGAVSSVQLQAMCFRVSRHELNGRLVAGYRMLSLEWQDTGGLATFCQYFGPFSFHTTACQNKCMVSHHNAAGEIFKSVFNSRTKRYDAASIISYPPVNLSCSSYFLLRHSNKIPTTYFNFKWLYLQKNFTLLFQFFFSHNV